MNDGLYDGAEYVINEQKEEIASLKAALAVAEEALRSFGESGWEAWYDADSVKKAINAIAEIKEQQKKI